MDNLRRLEEIFTKFPGIGPKQARRFVYYLLTRSSQYIEEFSQLIKETKKMSFECNSCHRLFLHSNKNIETCSVCLDSSRDFSTLMIVARDSDFEVIEKSGSYKGLYFILGGTIPILDKEPEKRVRLEQLLKRISNLKNLKEIILSLNTTPDGEHTLNIIREAIQRILNGNTVKISVLGRGLSTGAELEYADTETIKNALKNRG